MVAASEGDNSPSATASRVFLFRIPVFSVACMTARVRSSVVVMLVAGCMSSTCAAIQSAMMVLPNARHRTGMSSGDGV